MDQQHATRSDRPCGAHPAQRRTQPAVVPAASLLGEVFGGFWPERDVPARPGVLLGALGVGVLAGVVLPFRDLGLALTLVLLAAGGVVLVASRHRRDPFTLDCRRRLRAARPHPGPARRRVAGGAEPAGRGRAVRGRGDPRPHPARLPARRRLLAPGRAPRAALAGPDPRRPDRTRPAGGGAAHAGVVGAGAGGLRRSVRLRRRPARPVGGRAGPRPAAWTRPSPGCSSGSPSVAPCSPRRTSRSTRRGWSRVARPPAAAARRFEWLAPVLVVNAVFAVLPRRAGDGRLRRPRLPAAYHRPHLRRLRPPGLRPAHRRDRADAAGRRAGRPQGGARRTGPGCSGRWACCWRRPSSWSPRRCTGSTSTRRPTASPGCGCWWSSSRAGSGCWCWR